MLVLKFLYAYTFEVSYIFCEENYCIDKLINLTIIHT